MLPTRATGPEAERERLHQAARALEALVLKQLVTASKAFTGGEGPGNGVRADMFADALADAMVKGGGIGLANQIERSVMPRASSTAIALPSGAPAGQPSHPRDPASPTPADPPSWSRATAPVHVETWPGVHRDERGQWSLPLPSSHLPPVTSPFGPRQDPFDGHLTRHDGVDLAGGEGADIRAPAEGVVKRSGPLAGYGNAVEIDHGNGLSTLYAHASDLLVRDGERVTPGQTIARVGHTGRATGSHLHFEVRVGGRPVEPTRALKIYGLRADDLIGGGS